MPKPIRLTITQDEWSQKQAIGQASQVGTKKYLLIDGDGVTLLIPVEIITHSIHSKEWFDSAFRGMAIPADIQEATESIVRAYNIQGICDPGYIANVIALKLSRGDGHSNFYQQ